MRKSTAGPWAAIRQGYSPGRVQSSFPGTVWREIATGSNLTRMSSRPHAGEDTQHPRPADVAGEGAGADADARAVGATVGPHPRANSWTRMSRTLSLSAIAQRLSRLRGRGDCQTVGPKATRCDRDGSNSLNPRPRFPYPGIALGSAPGASMLDNVDLIAVGVLQGPAVCLYSHQTILAAVLNLGLARASPLDTSRHSRLAWGSSHGFAFPFIQRRQGGLETRPDRWPLRLCVFAVSFEVSACPAAGRGAQSPAGYGVHRSDSCAPAFQRRPAQVPRPGVSAVTEQLAREDLGLHLPVYLLIPEP